MASFPELVNGKVEQAIRNRLIEALSQPAFSLLSDHLKNTFSHFVLTTGTRLGPRLLVATRPGYEPLDEEAELDVAVGLELVQLSALIRDELTRGGSTRRDSPAFHQMIRDRGDATDHTRDPFILSMAFSDLLLGIGTGTILNGPLDAALKNRVLAQMMESLVTNVGGALSGITYQAFATVDPNIVRKIHGYQSAEHAFHLPLVLGGILGNAPPDELARLGEIGTLLGRAFQINEDLEDLQRFLLRRNADEESWRLASRTLPMALGLQALPRQESEELRQEIVRSHAPEATTRLSRALEATGAVTRARSEAHDLFLEAHAKFQTLRMASQAARALWKFLERLFGR